ncbi:GMC family oxidoreductase [Polynucleobacter sp. IMCC 29146]|uniref:GMC family oxidoreductase n=1 Tax=Polynucleobacter sp. IMCC 29146 TaxID=2780953 RepID=UPI001F34EF16|nr:GMC family oxidoreductase N-terminal domain-containing protein [Polynucleobacter sp. IMCC 29146]MCE7529665.1 GMC family oxidoreductase N-terminal domain-containing protein [Polynucleobacter sp. IMCC 29146]
MNDKKYDYIIIGAGSAGCLLAKRLTEDPTVSVLLVEAGKKDDYLWIHIPVGYLYCIDNPRTDWRFRTTADPGLNGRSLIYPRGKVLGGSSSINGMIYMRGQAADYESWAQETGEPAWGWQPSLKRYKQFEDYFGGQNAWHGVGGEWRVERQRLNWPILEIFKEAAQEQGIPASADFNRGDNFGVGYFDVNQKSGWRLNAARAFLKDAASRKNLQVITEALVQKLIINSSTKRCEGVTFIKDQRLHSVACAQEVILCAGAIGSVQILERSGIGSGKHLQQLGIPVQSDLPGVGENLQDHLQLRLIYQIKGIATLNTKANSLWGKALIGLEYLLRRTGPMAMAPSQLGAFAYSSEQQKRPNLEYHVQPLSLEKFGENLHDFNAFTASVCNLRPTSRGSVHISSTDCNAAPTIITNYLSTPADCQVAVEALALTRKIISSSAFKPFQPKEYKPGMQFQSEAELIDAARNIGTTIFHPVGTCKMGAKDDLQAVLDAELRVKGIDGLRVADAAAMPSITSGNTAAPTMMLAQRLAELIQSKPLNG